MQVGIAIITYERPGFVQRQLEETVAPNLAHLRAVNHGDLRYAVAIVDDGSTDWRPIRPPGSLGYAIAVERFERNRGVWYRKEASGRASSGAAARSRVALGT